MRFLVVGSTPTWSIIPHFFRARVFKSSHYWHFLFWLSFTFWCFCRPGCPRLRSASAWRFSQKISSASSFYIFDVYIMRLECMMVPTLVFLIQALVGLYRKSLLLFAVKRFQSANSLCYQYKSHYKIPRC